MTEWEVRGARCVVPCAHAVKVGYCEQCYSKKESPALWWLKFDHHCIVCGKPFRGWKWERYCRRHSQLRHAHPLLAAEACYTRRDTPKFSPTDAEDLLESAVASIRILKPNGDVDEERTQIERGKWLTRKLQGAWQELAEVDELPAEVDLPE